jgi:hypothetical protein
MCPPVSNDFYGQMRRAAGLMTSNDFVHWSPNHLILQPDELDDCLARQRIMNASPILRYSQPQGHRAEFYEMGLLPYGDVLLGFLWVFDPTGGSPKKDVQDGPVHLQLVGTRDLVRWNRLGERMPLLSPGDVGQWDGGVIYPCNRPLMVGNEIWLYYGGCNQGHGTDRETTGAIGLATWRRDGFVSINANRHPGTLTTKPFSFSGMELSLNYQALSGGSVRVEILDERGQPLPGFSLDDCHPLNGDDVGQVVSWNAGATPEALADRPIRLRFVLTAARLYSFQCS